MKLFASIAAACALSASLALPASAGQVYGHYGPSYAPQPYHGSNYGPPPGAYYGGPRGHYSPHYGNRHFGDRRCSGDRAAGTIIGGILGGVIGNNAAGGRNRGAATFGGAVVGGLLGNAIGGSACRDRHDARYGYGPRYDDRNYRGQYASPYPRDDYGPYEGGDYGEGFEGEGGTYDADAPYSPYGPSYGED